MNIVLRQVNPSSNERERFGVEMAAAQGKRCTQSDAYERRRALHASLVFDPKMRLWASLPTMAPIRAELAHHNSNMVDVTTRLTAGPDDMLDTLRWARQATTFGAAWAHVLARADFIQARELLFGVALQFHPTASADSVNRAQWQLVLQALLLQRDDVAAAAAIASVPHFLDTTLLAVTSRLPVRHIPRWMLTRLVQDSRRIFGGPDFTQLASAWSRGMKEWHHDHILFLLHELMKEVNPVAQSLMLRLVSERVAHSQLWREDIAPALIRFGGLGVYESNMLKNILIRMQGHE